MSEYLDGIAYDLQEIFQRSLTRLPVSKDLPRLARRFVVLDSTDCPLPFTQDVANDKIEDVCFNLLLCMRNQIQALEESQGKPVDNSEKEEFANKIRSDYAKNVRLADHYSLTSFLLNNFGIPGDDDEKPIVVESDKKALRFKRNSFSLKGLPTSYKLISLLKLCNQAVVISSGAYIRRSLLDHDIFFKDAQGGWQIIIQVDADFPSVTHRRTELVYYVDDTTGALVNCFTFTWEILIELTPQMDSLHSVNLKFLDTNFSNLDDSSPYKYDQGKQDQATRTIASVFDNSKQITNLENEPVLNPRQLEPLVDMDKRLRRRASSKPAKGIFANHTSKIMGSIVTVGLCLFTAYYLRHKNISLRSLFRGDKA